jgi:hypothetical protein
MGKIAIINDTHFGVRNGSDIFMDYMDKFFTDVFFPYCQENDIKRILHMGDFFDHRKYINIKALKRVDDFFTSRLDEYDMTMDIIPGNHDVYYKNTNELNSLEEILSGNERIRIHMNPVDIEFDNLSIGMLPWISHENYDECMEFIQSSKSPIIASHLELNGFKMMKGAVVASHGMDPKLFSRYEMVLSGHYHTKSEEDNIHYLGTQYELTWADAGDPKHFHILDTNTREIEPVKNKHCLFQRIRYNDTQSLPEISKKDIEGTFVKVVVVKKKDLYAFDKFIDKVQSYGPFDIKIVENFDEYSGENVDNDKISTVDTPTLLNTYVDSIETDLNKEKLKNILYDLYVEAKDLEAI